MNYSSGDVYKGEWESGERHGQGMCFYAAGDVYDGAWFCDKRHGFGARIVELGHAHTRPHALTRTRAHARCPPRRDCRAVSDVEVCPR